MNIKWNEYTWYSRWASFIFFLLILPLLTFYIGIQYQKTYDLTVDKIPVKDTLYNSTSTIDSSGLNMSKWLTYTNNIYGISFKYPNNFNILESTTGTSSRSVNQSINIQSKDTDIDGYAKDWIEINMSCDYNSPTGPIGIDNFGTVSSTTTINIGGISTELAMFTPENNGKTFFIQLSSNTGNEKRDSCSIIILGNKLLSSTDSRILSSFNFSKDFETTKDIMYKLEMAKSGFIKINHITN